MKEVIGYEPSKDPRLISCKTECGNLKCYARRYGLFAEKTCPNFVEPKPMTNADSIRSMSDEELASELAISGCPRIHFIKDDDGEFEPCPSGRTPSEKDCYNCWLDWLKQEEQNDSP